MFVIKINIFCDVACLGLGWRCIGSLIITNLVWGINFEFFVLKWRLVEVDFFCLHFWFWNFSLKFEFEKTIKFSFWCDFWLLFLFWIKFGVFEVKILRSSLYNGFSKCNLNTSIGQLGFIFSGAFVFLFWKNFYLREFWDLKIFILSMLLNQFW